MAQNPARSILEGNACHRSIRVGRGVRESRPQMIKSGKAILDGSISVDRLTQKLCEQFEEAAVRSD